MLKQLIGKTIVKRLHLMGKERKCFHSLQNSFRNPRIINTVHYRSYSENSAVPVSNENNYALDILSKINTSNQALRLSHLNVEINSYEEFNSVLDNNWRESSASNIVKTLKSVTNFCAKNNINISDKRFDKLVDGIMDNCEDLTVNEIADILKCMSQMPLTENYNSHNFHDLWSCLDDICCWKMLEWDTDTSIEVAKLWYKAHLGRLCDFTFILLDRMVRYADRLTKDQLVNVFFIYNICRSRAIDFEFEYALEKIVHKLNIDELAIVAMGYFKTKTKIKLDPIMKAMVTGVIQNSKSIQDIPLTAILKILRYSRSSKALPEIKVMLDLLCNEIPRLSNLSCLHIAILGTNSLQFCHPESLKKVCNKLVPHISNVNEVRLKDIERILLALTMFDFDPKTKPDIFRECYNELHKQSRISEEVKYSRSLVSALFFLSIKNIYSYELMNRVLDTDFIFIHYGKSPRLLPREILSLDCSIDIECPGYEGIRLPPDLKYRGAKWLTEFIPTYDYAKPSAADKFYLDVLGTIKGFVDERCILQHHILPHFVKADIILCRKKSTNEFIQPTGFENYILGDVMFPVKDDDLEWFACVCVGWINTIRDTNLPLGQTLFKKRQLEKIGYKTILVTWNEFMNLTPEDKRLYILNKLNKSL